VGKGRRLEQGVDLDDPIGIQITPDFWTVPVFRSCMGFSFPSDGCDRVKVKDGRTARAGGMMKEIIKG